jgi:transcription elongation factor SPT6
MDHQPHVVALGAVNLSCTRLKDDIYEVIFQMVEEKPRDVGHGMDDLSIVYVDESLPRLYENSRISGEQLPQQSGNVRRAVALGRYLQNPLAMVATLCGPGREILSWKLHPLENFLQLDEKYGMVEQVMVDITNQVGIDINLAASHDWFFSPLQFISGLGPRKAASLQRSLVRAGSIFVRKDLIMHGLGKKVFVNAAGFLRIRRSGLAASSSQFIDLLDDTRIHPESYSLAQELAKDIYDEDVRGDSNDDEDAIEMAIEHVRDRPASLRKVVLDEYLASKKRENKKETYSNIIRELSCGFQDWRIPFKEPSPDEEFYMISGETEDTIAEGRIVQASVRRLQNGRAICVLDSGLTGMLMKEDFSDDGRDIVDLADQLKEGDILTCKIKSIQKQRYQVFLICKESEMRNNRHQHNQNVDAYYHEDRNSLQLVKEKARKEKELVRKHFKSRMIVHPRFQNITADQATEYLSDKDFGESIVRPSSRGLNFLTLTLKIYDGVYAHKEIAEGGKENKDITSLQCIGKTLTIGEDTFEDLDEVMDRYVDPLVSHLKTMLNYRKFRKGTKSEVDDLLRIEKGENPSRIVYCFGISHEHPGTFILSYIRSTNPHHEYIGLYPKGFKFRKRMFEDIDRLVAYFQRHIDDPLQESAPSIRSIAAKVPMRSPADHGSSGGSGWGSSQSEGGWKGNSDRSGSGNAF